MKKRIVILDDEAHIRNNLARRLEGQGYSVSKAKNVLQLKDIILTQEIDFAIVDLKIDFRDEYGGTHAINFIKRNQPQVKTVILSGYQLDDQIRSLLEFEIDGYVYKGGPENYITAVIRKIQGLEAQEKKKLCFVIMPFSGTKTCTGEEWTDIFEDLIQSAVEESGFNYECKRAWAVVGDIMDNVLRDLNQADLVIADLTDNNPNVLYELGIRHSLRDKALLISQNINDIPIDLNGLAVHEYHWTTRQGKQTFKKLVKKLLENIEDKPEFTQSPIRKYLSL